jgi:hypothetical protein
VNRWPHSTRYSAVNLVRTGVPLSTSCAVCLSVRWPCRPFSLTQIYFCMTSPSKEEDREDGGVVRLAGIDFTSLGRRLYQLTRTLVETPCEYYYTDHFLTSLHLAALNGTFSPSLSLESYAHPLYLTPPLTICST